MVHSFKTAILLGAPGAGKGTIAEGIKTSTACTHVSTGDMLREEVKKGSPVGCRAESFMKQGILVPDDVIIQMVAQRLDATEHGTLVLFDGFPRTVRQAELLNECLAARGSRVNWVFFLDAPEALLISRLTGRRICRQCGANYHVVNIPPKTPGVCDVCGGGLYQRPDDEEQTIRRRLDVFEKQTAELMDFYEKQGVFFRVDSSRPRGDTVEEILRIMGATAA